MIGFLDRALVEQVDWQEGRAVWMTRAPLRYVSAHLGTLVIPAEFITDLASVPRVALAYWIAGGRGTRSAILHDFPYQFGYWLRDDGSQLHVSKVTADEEFHTSLLSDPISGAVGAEARHMYQAERAGGRGVWENDARAWALNPEWSATNTEAP